SRRASNGETGPDITGAMPIHPKINPVIVSFILCVPRSPFLEWFAYHYSERVNGSAEREKERDKCARETVFQKCIAAHSLQNYPAEMRGTARMIRSPRPKISAERFRRRSFWRLQFRR